jgi:hypothetical protein
MEQKNLYDQYNYQLVGSSRNNGALTIGPDPNPNPNRIVGSTLLKVHACPADDPPPQVTSNPRTSNEYEREKTRRSNYLFNCANYVDTSLYINQRTDVKGPFGCNGAATLATIRDGTANTICIGESKQRHLSTSYGPYWGVGVHTSVTGKTIAVPSGVNPMDPNLPIARCYLPNYRYSTDPACQTPTTNQQLWPLQYAWGFGSWHPSVTQFVMCDGAVKGLNDKITPAVWLAYTTSEAGDSWIVGSTGAN